MICSELGRLGRVVRSKADIKKEQTILVWSPIGAYDARSKEINPRLVNADEYHFGQALFEDLPLLQDLLRGGFRYR
ncbi:hypothetical protein Sjap_006979 [Stephania japonica]|uniref:Uncharacterized protein n=1 Tax=Stephania japonica TaxID=461633 RepID=A0AAP0K6U5_9MAGN